MHLLPTLHRSILSSALLALLSGCGSDATSPKREDAFTVQEASAIALAIFDEMSNALAEVTFNRAPAAAAAVPTTTTQSYSANCTKGGTISGSVTVTSDETSAGGGTANGTMSINPRGCKVSTGTRLIAVDGQLLYTFDMTISENFDALRFKIRGQGSFTWSGGRCDMDYTMNLTGQTASMSGSVCGVDVSGTY